jgi:hypothetical protein
MALEPVAGAIDAPTSTPDPFAAALTTAIIKPEAEPTPTPEPTPEPEATPEPTPEPTSTPEKKDPVEELPDSKDKDENPLPIDEELPEEEEIVVPEGKKDKVGYKIETLTKQIKNEFKPKIAAQEQEIAQYKARITELEGSSNELTTLRQKLADNEAELAVVALQRTDKYKELVDAPLDEIEAKGKKIAEAYELDWNKLADVLEMSDETARKKAYRELTSGLDVDPSDSYALLTLADKAQAAFAKRDELLGNATAALAELEARKTGEMQAAAAALAEERVKMVDTVTGRITTKLPFFKEAFDGVVDTVKGKNFDALTVTDHVYNAAAGAALPKIAQAYAKLQKDLDSALADLEGYQKAQPKPGGFTPAKPGSVRQEGVTTSANPFGDALKRSLGVG